jgi:asparagine synthase (glutamine-hydrolysing)
MCDAIRHRGPDDDGLWHRGGVALGMRRLSIIDVAGGKQPIANEDESARIVFNGEIYNYRALRDRLRRGGHRLATHSDTETVVHLYEDLAEACVSELRGMYAFAIWDERRERLMLARDRLGIKPLYYWETPEGIGFASELWALLALPRFVRTVDRAAIAWYLALGYVPDPHCALSGVRKLPPGHTLIWDRRGGTRVSRYWSPVRPELHRVQEAEAIAELRRLTADAVTSHLESEVPLGAFLSGGTDSSAVVAYMRRALDRPVRTFSIGFDEPEYNEAPHAALVARSLGTEHTELIVRPDAASLLDETLSVFDEPFGDASAVPTLLVSRLARQHVTVALSGDGGDELFGGYTRYAYVLAANDYPPALRMLLGGLARRLPHGTPWRGRLLNLSRSRRGRYAAQVSAPLTVSEGGVLRPSVAHSTGSFEQLMEPWFNEAEDRDFLTQMTIVDLFTYLPGDILTKVDRASMAVSLEARVPLLDHHLVEFAVSLPASLKMREGSGKWILRRAIDGIVPPEVLARPKRGFTLPLRDWFRGPLRSRVERLSDERNHVIEFVEPAAVRRLVKEHMTGRKDHYTWLWRLLALEAWLSRQAGATSAAA